MKEKTVFLRGMARGLEIAAQMREEEKELVACSWCNVPLGTWKDNLDQIREHVTHCEKAPLTAMVKTLQEERRALQAANTSLAHRADVLEAEKARNGDMLRCAKACIAKLEAQLKAKKAILSAKTRRELGRNRSRLKSRS